MSRDVEHKEREKKRENKPIEKRINKQKDEKTKRLNIKLLLLPASTRRMLTRSVKFKASGLRATLHS